ncbi:MAG: hypothetical protein Q9197_002667 [Variospora fuerteventurae]
MPAPGGDFLARMLIGSDKMDEIDHRQQAAARAWKAAGRELKAKKQNAAAHTPSESRYTTEDYEESPPPQRRGTIGYRGGGIRGGELARRDTERERQTTRAGAGGQAQRLMDDFYGVGEAAAPSSHRSTRQGEDGPAGKFSQQVRSSSHKHSHKHGGPSHGRDAGLSRSKSTRHAGNTHPSATGKSHTTTAYGEEDYEEKYEHGKKLVEVVPRISNQSETPRDELRRSGASRKSTQNKPAFPTW